MLIKIRYPNTVTAMILMSLRRDYQKFRVEFSARSSSFSVALANCYLTLLMSPKKHERSCPFSGAKKAHKVEKVSNFFSKDWADAPDKQGHK